MGGAAWRVLDAQFYREYQRRRRVFLVINTRDWRRSAPVLFERESLRWDYPSSGEKRQALADGLAGVTGAAAQSAVAIAGNIIGRRDGNGGNGYGYERDGAMYTLTATDVHGVWCAGDSGTNMPYYHDMAPTLTAHDANSACFVNAPSTRIIRSGKEGGGKGALVQRDMSATLTTAQQQTLFTGDADAFFGATAHASRVRETARLPGRMDGRAVAWCRACA